MRLEEIKKKLVKKIPQKNFQFFFEELCLRKKLFLTYRFRNSRGKCFWGSLSGAIRAKKKKISGAEDFSKCQLFSTKKKFNFIWIYKDKSLGEKLKKFGFLFYCKIFRKFFFTIFFDNKNFFYKISIFCIGNCWIFFIKTHGDLLGNRLILASLGRSPRCLQAIFQISKPF